MAAQDTVPPLIASTFIGLIGINTSPFTGKIGVEEVVSTTQVNQKEYDICLSSHTP